MTDFIAANEAYDQTVRGALAQMPFFRLLQLEIVELQAGSAHLVLPYRVELSQGTGVFQAGAVGTLADIAGGAASGTLLPPGWQLVTVDYTLKLVGVPMGERLHARASVVKPSQTLTVSRVDVFSDVKGNLRLAATALVSVKPIEPPAR